MLEKPIYKAASTKMTNCGAIGWDPRGDPWDPSGGDHGNPRVVLMGTHRGCPLEPLGVAHGNPRWAHGTKLHYVSHVGKSINNLFVFVMHVSDFTCM